jgi:CheY-like chemotaxis protein
MDATQDPVEPQTPRLVPQDILVVEDDFIIALDLEDMLRGLGVGRVRVAVSVPQALEMIAAAAPEFGLIDVNLGNDKSFTVAERLMELGVPFVFTTGYGDKYAFPAGFSDAQIVSKPYTIEALRAAILP